MEKGTTSVKTFVISLLNKLLLKHLKHLGFVYIQLIHMHNYSTCMQNCFLLCINSVFSTNQVTNVVTEVVPFCKSGHIYIYNDQCIIYNDST